MNFHTHSLSNVLTTSMLSLKETWTTASGVNSIWSSPETGGKLNLLYLSSFTCSCGLACLWKEVNWILNYTKSIFNYGKNSLASLVQRRDRCLRLISSSTTYGNICLLEQEQIMREYLPWSLLVYPEDFSKFQGAIWRSDPRITTVVGHRGTLSLSLLFWFPLQI